LKPEDATAIEHESFRSAQQPQANLDKKKKIFFSNFNFYLFFYIAECPTRPECFKRIPPLDAAAATLPFRSITIAPTVSNRSVSSLS